MKLSEELEAIMERVPDEKYYADNREYWLIDNQTLEELIKFLKEHNC